MPALTLSFFALVAAATHAAAAIAIGSYFCGGNDDDPIHDSHNSSSSHSRPSARIQNQPSYRPPPLPPSHAYRPAETYPQTIPRTPAPPDPDRGVYYPSIVSPYTRTPSQTQPSASIKPSIAQYTATSSRASVPPCVPTERDPLLPTGIRGVSRSNVGSPYARTPSQTQPSAIRTQPSSTSTLTQPSSTRVQPSSSLIQPTFTRIQPTSTVTQPTFTFTQPVPQPTSTVTQASRQHSSLNTVHANETSSHVPPRAHIRSKLPPPTVVQVISPDLEDLDFAKKLREQALGKGREMSEARSRAKSAKKKGYPAAVQVHNQQAITDERAMKELDKRAAKIIFKEKNKVGRWMDIRRVLPKVVLNLSLS